MYVSRINLYGSSKLYTTGVFKNIASLYLKKIEMDY